MPAFKVTMDVDGEVVQESHAPRYRRLIYGKNQHDRRCSCNSKTVSTTKAAVGIPFVSPFSVGRRLSTPDEAETRLRLVERASASDAPTKQREGVPHSQLLHFHNAI